MAVSRMARSAPGSTTMYMERIDDISHSYPFSGGSPYYGYLFYTAEGDTAYCVEPARFNSTTGTVVTGSKTYSGLSRTQQNEIAGPSPPIPAATPTPTNIWPARPSFGRSPTTSLPVGAASTTLSSPKIPGKPPPTTRRSVRRWRTWARSPAL